LDKTFLVGEREFLPMFKQIFKLPLIRQTSVRSLATAALPSDQLRMNKFILSAIPKLIQKSSIYKDELTLYCDKSNIIKVSLSHQGLSFSSRSFFLIKVFLSHQGSSFSSRSSLSYKGPLVFEAKLETQVHPGRRYLRFLGLI
jgi:hypothetical protein